MDNPTEKREAYEKDSLKKLDEPDIERMMRESRNLADRLVEAAKQGNFTSRGAS